MDKKNQEISVLKESSFAIIPSLTAQKLIFKVGNMSILQFLYVTQFFLIYPKQFSRTITIRQYRKLPEDSPLPLFSMRTLR